MLLKSQKKKISKNGRGKMSCRNKKCQMQIPIHTHVCKNCGFVNAKKSKADIYDWPLIRKVFEDPAKLGELKKEQLNLIKDYLMNSAFQVSFCCKQRLMKESHLPGERNRFAQCVQTPQNE